MYRPPFQTTQKILTICTDIGILLGKMEGMNAPTPQPRLRRNNRVRTIHGTLSIEGNTLSLSQVTDVIEGKRVVGPPEDILEVKNAVEVYKKLRYWRGNSQESLLEAHGLMMKGLSSDVGRWRRGDVGVMKGSIVAHMAPPYHRVAQLMADLFSFLNDDLQTHWLVRAAVFHYELEFIHPFDDGNGRMGRLWQQVLLFEQHPSFEYLPIESLARQHQPGYYQVLGECDQKGDSTSFIEFMLSLVAQALSELLDFLQPPPNTRERRVETALAAFAVQSFTRRDYRRLHRQISSATASRDLRWAVEAGLLVRHGDKATTRYQVA